MLNDLTYPKTCGLIFEYAETWESICIRSIITRNQRALSGPFPDSAQISTVSKIGQSCRHGRQR